MAVVVEEACARARTSKGSLTKERRKERRGNEQAAARQQGRKQANGRGQRGHSGGIVAWQAVAVKKAPPPLPVHCTHCTHLIPRRRVRNTGWEEEGGKKKRLTAG